MIDITQRENDRVLLVTKWLFNLLLLFLTN